MPSEHRRSYDAQYYLKNRDKKLAYLKLWRDRNRDEIRRKGREYRDARKEEKNRWLREFRRNNKEIVNEWNRNAYHKRRGASTDDFTRPYMEILRHDPCSYCISVSNSVDHIDAITVGGTNKWDNLTGACKNCNGSKSTESLLFFLLRITQNGT